ncbi:MAG TPA: prepilin-type N-terminal cleavage/methylation domain-containing protein [Phycisphaerae bacterium]|nr:prepilin-type N-terminal cleavage/methylation domain-containing protein [Phycisphaerae bacterium]HRY66706.1 prepilin-type N-terminal cleavage/methylation domain-containing protein [Phycisphaerae bacterium]HSA29830.1 prepilin-type N-terminal cleavage/methylation domain-containing protein [Phycisphaerae bacterium]
MTRRKGFSLLELMIAIMILGIGIVMVATIFPVGLDLTRDTVQMDISQAVTDVGMAMMTVKVPGYKQLDKMADTAAVPAAARVLVPDILRTEMSVNGQISLQQQEVIDFLVGSVGSLKTDYGKVQVGPPYVWAPKNWPGLSPAQQTVPEFISRCRVFTEQTGWPSELAPEDEVSVVPAQNLPADYIKVAQKASEKTIDAVVKTMVLPTFRSAGNHLQPVVTLPRIHLLDQVYPPFPTAELYELSSSTAYSAYSASMWRPKDVGINTLTSVLRDLASRRYSWLAFSHRMLADPKHAEMLVTVVTLYRGDANARFARQKTIAGGSGYNVDFDFSSNDADHFDACWQPKADPTADEDWVFPVPWLVKLMAVNLESGEVYCAAEVARLLPAGSYFIIAQGKGQLRAGTFQKVLACEVKVLSSPKPRSAWALNDWSRLTVARGKGSAQDVLAWVIPPAVERSGTAVSFQSRSPVVGVALRKVVAP